MPIDLRNAIASRMSGPGVASAAGVGLGCATGSSEPTGAGVVDEVAVAQPVTIEQHEAEDDGPEERGVRVHGLGTLGQGLARRAARQGVAASADGAVTTMPGARIGSGRPAASSSVRPGPVRAPFTSKKSS